MATSTRTRSAASGASAPSPSAIGGTATLDRPREAPAASPGQDAGRGGHLLTRDHEVIRQWADRRGARPATERGADDDRPGDLRFDFEGGDDQSLRTTSWDEWFDEFDRRDLVFIYLEPSDGEGGNFFRLESAER